MRQNFYSELISVKFLSFLKLYISTGISKIFPPMSEPRILVLPFRAWKIGFPWHWEEAGTHRTWLKIQRMVSQSDSHSNHRKSFKHLVGNQENYKTDVLAWIWTIACSSKWERQKKDTSSYHPVNTLSSHNNCVCVCVCVSVCVFSIQESHDIRNNK